MRLTDFNALADAAAADVVASWAAVPRWIDALVDGRPYASVTRLMAAADDAAATWTGEEVEDALRDHPRIGEKHAGGGRSAAHSSREQAGVDRTDADLMERLARGNARYEERFGRIYLVRAAGRTAAEMLDFLEERLAHDDATELAVTAGQLREIALLRLRGALEEDA